MADTITGLIPDIYEAMDIVSREKVGMIQSVTLDNKEGRAAKDQSIVVDVAPAVAGRDITPAMTPTAAADLTEGTKSVTMSNSRSFAFNFSGVNTQILNTSIGSANTRAGRIAQALRAASNEMEGVLAALHISASRAYGTAGTTPFGSALTDAAQSAKILDDNGAPAVDRSLVLNTSAGANLRGLAQYNGVNTSGSDMTLRRGELLDLYGMSVKESGQIATNTAGTGASYLVNNASGYAVGATTIAADTGSGTILAGDIVTFAGDSNKYVVATALSGGSFVLAAPGLQKALADNVAITVVAAAARNFAFSRNAIVLATRLPELPTEGDGAADRMTIADPVSGMNFEFAIYKGYRQNLYEVGITYGAAVIKPEHTCLLLG